MGILDRFTKSLQERTDRKKNIYASIGNSGNVIYINPEKNIVVSVASYFKPTVFDRIDFIQQYIEALITE